MEARINPFDKKIYPNVYEGHQYSLDVVAGKIPNCKYVIGACQRYLDDLEKGEYPFEPQRAEKYLRIVQKFNHVKGKWSTKNIVYDPWQNFVFMNIMGFINPETGYRRFRTAHVEVPRGQGKSAMASQAALYFLAFDEPVGNEISCFATKSDQARIVLDSSRAMARANPTYRAKMGVEVLAHRIVQDRSNSFIRAMSSDSKSMDGLNDVLSVMDELHAMDRALFDVVSSGLSKRKDSLMLCITTAGVDIDSVGYSQSLYAKKVALGEVQDDSFFSIVYTIDEGDDIFSEDTWKKANPGYGGSVDEITMRAKALKAKETPSDLPNFKIKHLNVWISEANAFFDMEAFDKCADPSLKIEDFRGQKVILGVDIASKIDLASLGYIFKKDDIYYMFDKSYIPEATVARVRNVLYDNCIANGDLIATPGEAIDQQILKDQILKDKKTFSILEVPYDPWAATGFSQDLSKERLSMVEFRFNTSNLSEPTKSMDALMRQGKIRHNGSPLLRWAFSNVVCKVDAADNVFPKKSHEKLKIDPAIALIMALACWLEREQKVSVYEQRGVRHL